MSVIGAAKPSQVGASWPGDQVVDQRLVAAEQFGDRGGYVFGLYGIETRKGGEIEQRIRVHVCPESGSVRVPDRASASILAPPASTRSSACRMRPKTGTWCPGCCVFRMSGQPTRAQVARAPSCRRSTGCDCAVGLKSRIILPCRDVATWKIAACTRQNQGCRTIDDRTEGTGVGSRTRDGAPRCTERTDDPARRRRCDDQADGHPDADQSQASV
jgi:hypothetical protein